VLLARPVTHTSSAAEEVDGKGSHAHVKEGLDALGVLGGLEDVSAWFSVGH